MKHLILLVLFISTTATAGQVDRSFTYEGTLLDSGGAINNSSNVNFRIQILNPTKDCILYEENRNGVDLSDTDAPGQFSISVGLATGHASRGGNDVNNELAKVFSNNPSVAIAGTGSGCSYTPTGYAKRYLRVFVRDVANAGSEEMLSPDLDISSVPTAFSSETLQGHSPDDFVKSSADITQAKVGTVFTTANYNELMNLIAGTSSQYANSSGSNFSPSASVDFSAEKIVNLADPTAAQDAATKNYADSNIAGLNVNASVGSLGGADAGKQLQWNGSEWVVATNSMPSPSAGDAGKVLQVDASGSGFQFFTLGDVATYTAGSAAGNVPVLDASGFLPYSTIPGISANNITSDTLAIARGGTGQDFTGVTACAASESLTWDGSNFVCSTIPSSADNLGSHTASQNIDMQNNNLILGTGYVSGDGSAEGLQVDSSGNVSASANLNVVGDLKADASLIIEDPNVGLNAISVTAPVGLGASYSLVLPADDGNANEFLQTDGSGNLTWAAAGGGADNLGSHTASQNLDLDSNSIVNANSVTATSLSAGSINLSTGFRLSNAATAGYVLTASDSSGNASWQAIPSSADNLGSHTATTTLDMDSNSIANAGTVDASDVNTGNLEATGSVVFSGGSPSAGKVLAASDASGNASWVDPNTLVSGDDLGSHTAIQTLDLNGQSITMGGGLLNTENGIIQIGSGYLSGDGSAEGLQVAADGEVSTSGNAVIGGTIRIVGGTPGSGKVLTATDASGNASWQTPGSGADDLGSHTAIQNLDLDSNSIVNANNVSATSLSAVSIDLSSGFRLNNAATAGYVLTASDASGNASWQVIPSSADNLGSHTATQTFDLDGNNLTMGGAVLDTENGNIALGTGWLSYDGSSIGIQLDAAGNVTASNNVFVNGSLTIAGGTPGAGQVLTSDASGNATWEPVPSSADNLGSHTASQNLDLDSNSIVNANNVSATSLSAGSIDLSSGFRLNNAATAGYVLTASDSSGNASWQAIPSSADNLGSHTATQDLDMATSSIVNANNISAGSLSLSGGAAAGYYLKSDASGNGTWSALTVGSGEIVDGSITTADLGTSVVTSAKIADGTVDTADLKDGAVTLSKLAAGTPNSMWVLDGTGNPVELGLATCSAGSFNRWNGSGWSCETDSVGSGDNLGSHTAGQDLFMNNYNVILGTGWISNSGGASGLQVDGSGNVTTSNNLNVTGVMTGDVSTANLVITGGSGSIKYPHNANAGYVLTSDASGNATWAPSGSGADNLGNHSASQNVLLGSHYLSGDGSNEGLSIDGTGNVSLTHQLTVTGPILASGGINSPSGMLSGDDITIASGNSLILQDGSGSNTISLNAPPSVVANYSLELPTSDGSLGQVLEHDGSGRLQWVTPSVGASDDLGNHSANQNILMNGHEIVLAGGFISGDGGEEGLTVDASGDVTLSNNLRISNNNALFMFDSSGSYAALRAPSTISTNYILDMPTTAGSAGEFLVNTGGGVLAWGTPIGDNLGDHSASQNIQLGGHWLSGDGDFEGLQVDASGVVTATELTVNGAVNFDLNVGKYLNYEPNGGPGCADGDVLVKTANGFECSQAGSYNIDLGSSIVNTGDLDVDGRTRIINNNIVNDVLLLRAIGGQTGNMLRMEDAGGIEILSVDSAGNVNLKEGRGVTLFDDDNSAAIFLRSPNNLTATYNLMLPDDDGDPNQVLTTDGAGITSWTTVASLLGDDTITHNKIDNCSAAGEQLYFDGANWVCRLMLQSDGSGNFMHTGSQKLNIGGNINTNSMLNVRENGAVTSLLNLQDNGGTSVFNVSNTGDLQVNGAVGLGVTPSAVQLHVNGTSGSTLRITDSNQSAGRVLTSDISGNASWADLPDEDDPEVNVTTTGRIPYWNGTALVDSNISFSGSTSSLSGSGNSFRVTSSAAFEVLGTGSKLDVLSGGAINVAGSTSSITLSTGAKLNVNNDSGSGDVVRFGGIDFIRGQSNSTFLGQYAGENDDGGSNANVGVGSQALRGTTAGNNNTAIGTNSLMNNVTGFRNSALGSNALQLLNSGNENTAIGADSLSSLASGTRNTSVGSQSMWNSNNANYNSAYGNSSLREVAGDFNTGLGYRALEKAGAVDYNTVIGANAMSFDTGVGSFNTVVGGNAGYFNNGANNVMMGYQAGYNNTGSNNVFIGYNAGRDATGSDELYIDNSPTSTPLIYGDFASRRIAIDSNDTTKATFNVNTDGTSTAAIFASNTSTIAGEHVLELWTQSPTSPLYVISTSNITGTLIEGVANSSAPASFNLMQLRKGATESFAVNSNGNTRIGNPPPAPLATVNIAGTLKLQTHGAQPFACDAQHAGTLALTSNYVMCVCNGNFNQWRYSHDPATACAW